MAFAKFFLLAIILELLFRGFIYSKIKQIEDSKILSGIVSTLLFLLYFFFFSKVYLINVNLIFLLFMSVVFCISKETLEDCSLLSLIIAHGLFLSVEPLWYLL